MKKFATTLAVTLAVLSLWAGISSGLSDGSWITLAATEPRSVAVYLGMPADFVSVPVRVYSDQKDTALAYEELRQAMALIRQKARQEGQVRISPGAVSLTQYRSSYGISSGSWNEPAASAEIFILVPFSMGNTNIYTCGAVAARLMAAVQFPGKARCELGHLQLAVENPEQYRSKLLNLITEDIAKTRGALALTNGNIKLDGLASPVMVRQTDDRQVELYLNYALAITAEK